MPNTWRHRKIRAGFYRAPTRPRKPFWFQELSSWTLRARQPGRDAPAVCCVQLPDPERRHPAKGPFEDRTFEIELLVPGARAPDFTFG